MGHLDTDTPILIVEADAAMLRIIRDELDQLGIGSVDEAGVGREALVKLLDRTFGLVISGWNMEPMNGLQLLRTVRADRCLGDLFCVMVIPDGARASEDVAAARLAGAGSDRVKPFSTATLKRELAAVLGPF